jgi:hypothetical protein
MRPLLLTVIWRQRAEQSIEDGTKIRDAFDGSGKQPGGHKNAA